MEKDQEIELKLAVLDPDEIDRIIADEFLLSLSVRPWQTERLVSTYYDTEQHGLMDKHLTFRIRANGKGYEATVKGGGKIVGGLHERQEWNVPLKTASADIEIFAATGIGDQLREIVNGEPLLPLFTTDFMRQSLLVDYGTSVIEVAVDQGEIAAGDQTESLLEMELELKSGVSIDLIILGALLANRFKLRQEGRSKYQRGLGMVGGSC